MGLKQDLREAADRTLNRVVGKEPLTESAFENHKQANGMTWEAIQARLAAKKNSKQTLNINPEDSDWEKAKQVNGLTWEQVQERRAARNAPDPGTPKESLLVPTPESQRITATNDLGYSPKNLPPDGIKLSEFLPSVKISI